MHYLLDRSNTVTNISQALLSVRRETMKVKPKEAVNPHFKNKFMPLAEVLRVSAQPLERAGVLMMQAQGRDKERPDYVAVETLLIHAESGEYYCATMSMRPKNEEPQAALSCATYMKRSCLASLLGLSLWSEDDDGEGATDHDAVERPKNYTATMTKLQELPLKEAYQKVTKKPTAFKRFLMQDDTYAEFVLALAAHGNSLKANGDANASQDS
jgi:hypothetical protein